MLSILPVRHYVLPPQMGFGGHRSQSMTVLSAEHDIDILISETEIAARTTQLARMISEQYRDTEQLVVVGLLRGSFVFIADLVRRLDLPVEVDFMTVSSYGNKMVSSRQVRIIQDLETPIAGILQMTTSRRKPLSDKIKLLSTY